MLASHLRRPVLACAFLLLASAALAGEGYLGIAQRLTPAQLAEVGLSPHQLELLDRYLSESEAPPPGTAAAGEGADTTRAQAGDRRPRDSSAFVGLGDEPIHSRLKGRVDGWEPGTVFELGNGQQWKVLKGRMRLSKPVEAPQIVVVPGIAGRWFLQVDPDLPKARVYRID